MLGSCRPPTPKSKSRGYRRGEWAGVASGVFSGVGEQLSSACDEKSGDDGAVDTGELGRDFLTDRCDTYWSSSSCECERDIGRLRPPRAARAEVGGGSRLLLLLLPLLLCHG